MKLVGFICNVEMGVANPSFAAEDPFEAVRRGDACKIVEDENGVKWVETPVRRSAYEGEKVYSTDQWKEAHWAALIDFLAKR